MQNRKKDKFNSKSLGQKGQAVMEYIIISSLVGIFCLIAVKQFGEVVQKRIEHMKEEIVEHIPTN